MNFNGIKVLLTDGGGRQTLTILHGLKEIGCHVTVLCSTKLDVCYNSKLPDARILDYDAAGSHDGFEEFIMKVLKEGNFDVLLPVAEITTNKVTLHEDEIKQYVKIACAPRSAYIQAFNKQRTFEKALEIGIPCPYTRRESQTVEDYLSKAKFPVIIKPRQGLGSIGFHKFETREEFDKALAEKTFNPDEYVIQEFVKFDKRIGTYIFMDQNCKTCASMAQEVLRWYPIDAGTAVLTRSIDAPDAIRYSRELLKALEWHGFANVGFMIDKETGEAKLLEINGRISAGVKLSWFCGINIAKQLMEMAYDQEVTEYPDNKKFGLMARHSHADISWFFKSKERFSCKPSWFSWKNTTDLVYWKGDMKPYFTYTLQKIFRYKEDISKRKH
ncbi:MAG: ATP-grasp domain-containing protein [Ruminococcus sp.]|nr:ATP-grasp domain-containing protein [Ruminococcus sp.]